MTCDPKRAEESRLLVDHFRRSGYIKVPRLFDEGAIGDVSTLLHQEFERAVAPVRRNDDGRVIRLDGLFQRIPVIADLLHNERLKGILMALLGPNIELSLNRHNHATVNLRGRAPDRLHRDVLQWSRSLVTMILYLEDSTIENGCTELIPTSQYLPFVGTPNNGGTWMDEHSVYSPLIDQAIPIPMKAGGVLLFDSLAFHKAGENLAGGNRLTLTLGFHSVDELAGSQYLDKNVIVFGERLYRGNDHLNSL